VLDGALARQLFGQMLLLRHFDEKVGDLFRKAKLPGFVHLYIGEEAIAVGVCAALRGDDYVTSTHRAHVEGEQPKYWDAEEQATWLALDPIPRFEVHLRDHYGATTEEIEALVAASVKRVGEAVAFAEAEPYPDQLEALTDVFAGTATAVAAVGPAGKGTR
jgi:TPP-dependent pyruvate/acetoin dehydrogenase alpha subunit